MSNYDAQEHEYADLASQFAQERREDNYEEAKHLLAQIIIARAQGALDPKKSLVIEDAARFLDSVGHDMVAMGTPYRGIVAKLNAAIQPTFSVGDDGEPMI